MYTSLQPLNDHFYPGRLTTVMYKIIRNIILHENCGRKIVSPKLGSSRQEAYTWYTKKSSTGNTTFLPNR